MKHLFITKRAMLVVGFMFLSLMGFAQTKLTGKVSDGTTKEKLPGASVAVKGLVVGTTTDANGNFSLNINAKLPVTLQVSFVGFATQEVEITGSKSGMDIVLKENAILGQEVVISASRVQETVLKSSASIEKMDIRMVQQSASPSFFDALVNMKGVESSMQSLTFRSINTRGFNANGNVRMVQMVDGMDSQAPGLNFSVGNIAGLSELDVESVELIPGAASALYGPNAINGVLLMNSKSPFLYKGLSAYAKSGVMHVNSPNGTPTSPFYDAGIRWAKSFNDKFAIKINASYLTAQDWAASNTADINGNLNGFNTRANTPNYNGVNVFGDETAADIRAVAGQMVTAGVLPAAALALVPAMNVTRTGYDERDLADYTTKSLKTNIGLHYRINNKVEAVLQANYGFGTTVYTGADRYSIRNFSIGQYKAEIKGDNFFIRGYTTQERSGDSYAVGTLGQLINEGWGGGSPRWFPTYVGAFVQARSGGLAEAQAHAAARAFADQNRPKPGSAEFNTIATNAKNVAIPNGAKFQDKTNLYHGEAMYNFKNQIKFVELLVGANYRMYDLNSGGTIFADKDGRKITIKEYGGYAQAAKQFGDWLKLTGSLRYDKNENFDGQFTPRISAVFTAAKDHNFRVSYQTGFRIPTTQDQYIDLKVPQARLVGGLPEFAARYNFATNPIYPLRNVQAYGAQVQALAGSAPVQAQATAILRDRVRVAVTPGVTQFVTQQVTAGITAQVTTSVTAQVNAAVTAGTIPASQAAAAITAGVAANLPAALAANLQPQVNAALPGAINTTIDQQLPAVLQANLANVASAIAGQQALGILQPFQAREWKPERVKSIEIGYKALINKDLYIDSYFYYNQYTNFSSGNTVIQVTPEGAQSLAAAGAPIQLGLLQGQNRQVYQFPGSSPGNTITHGWGVSLDYNLGRGYNVSGNVSHNKLRSFDQSILDNGGQTFFNTPEYRGNIAFGKRPQGSNGWGYNVTVRYQQAFLWQTSFVNTPNQNVSIVPAFTTVDAQVTKKLPSLKTILKIGGSNILNQYYVTSYGNPSIGGQYYVSLLFDEIFK